MTLQPDVEVLENPVTGESMRVLESTPAVFKAQYTMRPHGEIAGAHFHPNGEHLLMVLSGEMHVRIDGDHRIVRAGESATVPAGARHLQWNPGDVEAVVIEDLHPAARLHEFFRVLFRLAADGMTDAKGFPTPLLAAALFSEFNDTIRVASDRTRLLLSMLAPVASVLGKRRAIEGRLRQLRTV